MLQSLLRGEPYGGDLEALKDLALFPDLEYPEESQEERGARFNQSEAGDAPEGGPTGSSVAQIKASSEGNISQGDEHRTRRLTDPPAAENAVSGLSG